MPFPLAACDAALTCLARRCTTAVQLCVGSLEFDLLSRVAGSVSAGGARLASSSPVVRVPLPSAAYVDVIRAWAVCCAASSQSHVLVLA